jgi:hypothetical protein
MHPACKLTVWAGAAAISFAVYYGMYLALRAAYN